MAAHRRIVVLEAVMAAGVNLVRAARKLDVHRNTVNRLCEESGIDVWRLKKDRSYGARLLKQWREELLLL
jgi:hypothetical protein